MTVVAPGVFAASATHLLLLQIVDGQNLARVVRRLLAYQSSASSAISAAQRASGALCSLASE
jgi:hypothetical protein